MIGSPEDGEIPKDSKGLYLAGYFETGAGSLYLRINSAPAIYTRSQNKEEILALQNQFGGRVIETSHVRRNRSIFTWRIEGNEAVILARSMQPYTISRKQTIALMAEWNQLSNEERKNRLVFIEHAADKSPGKVADYEALAQNGAWMAGIYDARGSFVWDKESIELTSTIAPLLYGISKVWYGTMNHNYPKVATKKPTVRIDFTLTPSSTQRLIRSIKPYLTIHSFE